MSTGSLNAKHKIYYHVRHANGVTVDWLESRTMALALAGTEQAQCYEVDSTSGRATRIY